MLVFAETGEEPSEFVGNERFLWPVAKQGIEATAKKVETLKANGSKGGRPVTKCQEIKPDETKDNQTKANESLNVNVNVKVKDKVNNKFIPPTVEEVTAYCRERGNNVDPQTFVDFYSSKGWKVGNSPMKDWKACVRTWEKNRLPEYKPRTVTAQNYSQRDYSDEQSDAMARMLKGATG